MRWVFIAVLTVAATCGAATPQYRIKLTPFLAPPTRTVGLVIGARINGGPELRLLLDSGAQYIVLDRKSAERSRCTGQSRIELVGVGVAPATPVRMLRADSVDVGGLAVHDVPVLVEDHRLADGIQGAFPLSIFDRFVIRLDLPGKMLDLLPYPAERDESTGLIPITARNRAMFIQGSVNGAAGQFLLDTGAAYNAISRNMARELKLPESLADRVPLQAGTSSFDAALLSGDLTVRVGSQKLPADPLVAVDLATSSRYQGLEIAGLIGYPALRTSVLTISYRDRAMRIERR